MRGDFLDSVLTANPIPNRPPWLDLRPIRVRVNIEHTTPFDRQFTKEVVLVNSGRSNATDILIPSAEFFHGLQVLDENNHILSYYSVDEITTNVKMYEREIQENILRLLDEAYLLWIRLPDDRCIKPDEVRTIRLIFNDHENHKKSRFSLFDIPEFKENIPKLKNNVETYYFIRAPKDFVIDVISDKTKAWTVPMADKEMPQEVDINFMDGTMTQNDFKDTCIDIKNNENYVTARFPERDKHYNLNLIYQIKLPKMERYIWRSVLPFVGLVLLGFALVPFIISVEASFYQVSLAVGGIGSSAFGAIIALVNNPLIKRTRAILFIHFGLSALILANSAMFTFPKL